MAARHSSRGRPSGRAGPKNPKHATLKVPRAAASAAGRKQMARGVVRGAKRRKHATKPPNFDEGLEQFSHALALAETVHSALDALEERPGISRAIGSSLITLEQAVTEMRRAYTALDLAILHHRDGRVS